MRAGSGRLGVSAPPAPSDPARRWLTAPVIGLLRRHGDVLKNASSLLATTGVTSAMGFAYWTVAARLMSQRAVGFGSATVSAFAHNWLNLAIAVPYSAQIARSRGIPHALPPQARTRW